MAASSKQVLILDTDHVTAIDRETRLGVYLLDRLANSGSPFGTTIITVDEQLRGLLAEISRQRLEHKKIEWYGKLQTKIADLGTLRILGWDEPAVAVFERLRAARIRIGTMDLRIASIAIANSATLLTRNLKDFARVPGLRAENWLET